MTAPLDDSPGTPTTQTAPATATQATRGWRDLSELLSSMRFAISLLTLICIASVIGTVVKQNEPYNNYVNQFGPFWADVFGKLGLFTIYSSIWFLTILAFLVLSTSLCIARNTPKILADLRSFKEHVREQSLQAFHHKAQGSLSMNREASLAHVSAQLGQRGWRALAQVREHGTMVAARAGRVNKLGYLAAHSAVVLVCIGGLLDGDMVVRAQLWLTGKSVFDGGGFIKDVAPEHRLGPANPTFRGNLLVAEGARAGTAILSMPEGIVLQDLPFDIELKKFKVEYYDTGMPRLFASDVVIHDHDTGQATAATIKVNEPTTHRGVAIFQSSFEDGGSLVKLQAVPMKAGGKPFAVSLRVGDNTELSNGNDKLKLELTGLKVINVENLADTSEASETPKLDLGGTLNKHLGSGVSTDKVKTLRNVGPAVVYKLRDAAGQAREFHNYMVPMELDGQRVFVVGSRDNPADNFHYLRIPVDEVGGMAGWLRLRDALGQPSLRERAARRYASQAAPTDKPEMVEQLRLTGVRALAMFAGAATEGQTPGAEPEAGFVGFSRFIEASVPEAQRAKVGEVLLRILNGSLYELAQISREQAGLKPLEAGDFTQGFMTQAVLALSDSFAYPAPVMFQIDSFEQVQASVFQVTRGPGKTLVYLGAVLLIVGVFAMLYIRERRLWIWLSDDTEHPGHTRAMMAMSTPRRTLDIDAEFETLRHALLVSEPPPGEKTP